MKRKLDGPSLCPAHPRDNLRMRPKSRLPAKPRTISMLCARESSTPVPLPPPKRPGELSQHPQEQLKNPGNSGLFHESCELHRPAGKPFFSLSGHFSRKLSTLRFRCRAFISLFLNDFRNQQAVHFSNHGRAPSGPENQNSPLPNRCGAGSGTLPFSRSGKS